MKRFVLLYSLKVLLNKCEFKNYSSSTLNGSTYGIPEITNSRNSFSTFLDNINYIKNFV